MAKSYEERAKLFSQIGNAAVVELIAAYALACIERETLGEEVTWYQGLEWFAEELRLISRTAGG